MESIINVVHTSVNGKSKDANPFPKPVMPVRTGKHLKLHEKSGEGPNQEYDSLENKFKAAMTKYDEQLKLHDDAEKDLKEYDIASLRCDSGIILDASIIAFEVGGKRRALLQEDGRIMINPPA